MTDPGPPPPVIPPRTPTRSAYEIAIVYDTDTGRQSISGDLLATDGEPNSLFGDFVAALARRQIDWAAVQQVRISRRSDL
jgi:hypothetical protein